MLSALCTLIVAELVVRTLCLHPARYLRHQHLESSNKRFAIDAYPDNRDGTFPLDLGDWQTRQTLRTQGLNVGPIAHTTPYAVPSRYSAELCRGGDIPAIPDRPRVLVIGDSFSEGQGVAESQTFVALLQQRHPLMAILNCARRGYDFPRLAEWLTLRMNLRPKRVVYAMVLNDPEQSPAFAARQHFLNDWILDRRSTLDSVATPSAWTPQFPLLVHDRIQGWQVGNETTKWYRDMVGQPNRAGWQRTLEQLSQMQTQAQQQGASFAVAVWPLLIALERYPFTDTHHIIVRDIAARGIHVLDTLPAFAGQDTKMLWVHAMDHHPNGRAHRIFADAIAPLLAEPLLAEP